MCDGGGGGGVVIFCTDSFVYLSKENFQRFKFIKGAFTSILGGKRVFYFCQCDTLLMTARVEQNRHLNMSTYQYL